MLLAAQGYVSRNSLDGEAEGIPYAPVRPSVSVVATEARTAASAFSHDHHYPPSTSNADHSGSATPESNRVE